MPPAPCMGSHPQCSQHLSVIEKCLDFTYWLDSLCEVLRFLLGKGSNGIFIEIFFFRVYLWHDDKGKKITKTNVSAPQYIDYVMSCSHNYLHDDAVFPTKYGEFKGKGGGEFKKTCREHIIVKT